MNIICDKMGSFRYTENSLKKIELKHFSAEMSPYSHQYFNKFKIEMMM